MASRFRTGQQEFGSGGKILRGRRHFPPFSPYCRPSTSTAPLALTAPEPEAQRSPSWFRGLISGAGKLISSVIGSEGSGSSPSECSSDYSSDEEYDPLPNEHGDHFLSDGLAVFSKRESMVEGNVESLAIVSKHESKLLIEQLLMQETFTRDEYYKLMEILRSRVLDTPSAEGGDGIDKRAWKSLSQKRNISGNFNLSPSNPSVFSPRYNVSAAVTPDLRSKAVMEAKKWFEKKKLSPSPICDQECGPCILNTDMNQYCSDGDGGSPIERAKSYMQSLPPWRSPSISTIGFKNLPSSGKPSCSIGSYMLQTSKFKKSDYVAIESWHSKENSEVSLKSNGNRQAGSNTRPYVFEASRTSVATTNFGNEDQDERLQLNDRKAVEDGHQMEMLKEISRGIIVEPQEVFKEAEEVPKVASVNIIEHLNSGSVEMFPNDGDMLMLDKNQDVEVTLVTEAQIESNSAPHDSLVLVSMAGQNGYSFPGTETFLRENGAQAEPSIQKSFSEVKFRADNAIQVNPDPDFKHAHLFADSKPGDGNPHIHRHLIEVNNMNSDPESMNKGGPTSTNSSNGSGGGGGGGGGGGRGVAAIVFEKTREPDEPHGANENCSKKPLNDLNMKSMKRIMLAEASQVANARGKRTAKKVVRQKKWVG